MGNQIVWEDRFNVGVAVIDNEHKKLFGVLNKLLDMGKRDGKGKWVCQEAIKYFRDHTLQHFADEEEYMRSIGYSGLETHRRIHISFRDRTLPTLERELEITGYSPEAVDHFLGVCSGWLIGHSLLEDQLITGKGVSQWKNLLPDEEQSAMRQTVIQLLYDMFRLDSRLISDCYAGEKFGDGIYYRLIYISKNGEKWEIILVFEQKVIINTLGTVMGAQTGDVDVMMMNATRYVSRQFVERIKEQFPRFGEYEMAEEQLLTYEQFKKLFENQSPQYSMLFDTGKGYFAYCVIAPHLNLCEGSVPLIAENVMSQVERYLSENRQEKEIASRKNKVLIVDDSEFMLKTMQNLLSGDYEVATAKSGLSAFRDITLNRPDLVVLDYEMPICDGGQILEMIRSEEGFSDIPVIFLTSKVDRESVKKVIELKPEGYLSKTLQPDDIKREIDHFFEKRARRRR